jgi:uncharacterized membrane protein YvbJ
MKYCEYCGSEAQNYFSNCHSCGAPFSIKTVYSRDIQTNDSSESSFGYEAFMFKFLPILVTMAVISYAVDKVGNLFRFKRRKVEGIQSVRYTYEKRRGYL